MFSEGPLEFSASISCKMLPISQKEKKMVKQHLLFTKEKSKPNAKNPQLSLPFQCAGAAIQCLAGLLPKQHAGTSHFPTWYHKQNK